VAQRLSDEIKITDRLTGKGTASAVPRDTPSDVIPNRRDAKVRNLLCRDYINGCPILAAFTTPDSPSQPAFAARVVTANVKSGYFWVAQR
jgi:hypothetical protein